MHRPERLYFMSSIQRRRERRVWQLHKAEHCAGESNPGAVCGASGEQLLYYISIRNRRVFEERDNLRPAWKAYVLSTNSLVVSGNVVIAVLTFLSQIELV